uniref:Expressed protein n=1 Tax=Schizophyllum commune (strain H4-8 / FGSC 9210) TaxID=578458 RepID=D8QKC0_SCHCM
MIMNENKMSMQKGQYMRNDNDCVGMYGGDEDADTRSDVKPSEGRPRKSDGDTTE